MSSEYASYDIRQLFPMVDAARQTLDPSHEQIRAWNRAEQMLRQHATAMQGFRDQLAGKWPPETNPAAAAYLSELDRLLRAVDQTGQAAISNAVQIGHVTQAITQAHATLQPLHDEFVSNEAKIDRYNDTVNNIAIGVGIVQGPIAGLVTKGAAELFTSPPVGDGRQDQIQQQARQAMDTLSGAAHDAAVTMEPPPEYTPPTVSKANNTHMGSDSTGGATRPPTIAAPANHQPQEASTGGVEVPNGSGADGSASGSDTGAPGAGQSRPPSALTGPDLAGVITPPAPATVPAPLPAGGSALQPGPSVVPGMPPATIPGIVPTIAGPQIGGGGGRAAPATPALIGGGAGGSGARVLPPGGRIEGLHGTAAPWAGQVSGSQPGTRRVNPVGGVIGQPSGPSRTAGRAPMTNSGSPGAMQGRRGQSTSDDHGHDWDADQPWTVAEGVTPVILPEPARAIDTGPGIIGLDR